MDEEDEEVVDGRRSGKWTEELENGFDHKPLVTQTSCVGCEKCQDCEPVI